MTVEAHPLSELYRFSPVREPWLMEPDDECACGHIWQYGPEPPCDCPQWASMAPPWKQPAPAPKYEFPPLPLALPAPRPMLALPAPVPDLMSTLKHAKEAAMATAIVPNPNQYDEPAGPVYAPWGLKADGSPRKRPGRRPGPQQGGGRSLAVAPPAPTPEPDPDPDPDPVAGAVAVIDAEMARVRMERDAELARLAQARDTLANLTRRAAVAA